MKLILALILIPSLALASIPPNTGKELVTTAQKYSYVRENRGSNRSPEIDKFLKELGLPTGLAWCLAYVQHCWKETAERQKFKNPMPRGIARVSVFLHKAEANPYVFRVKSAKSLMLGASSPKAGDMTIHISGRDVTPQTNFNGHIGIVTSSINDRRGVYTIEGNTGPQPKSSKVKINAEHERNAGGASAGVHNRYRNYAPNGTFRIANLVEAR